MTECGLVELCVVDVSLGVVVCSVVVEERLVVFCGVVVEGMVVVLLVGVVVIRSVNKSEYKR